MAILKDEEKPWLPAKDVEGKYSLFVVCWSEATPHGKIVWNTCDMDDPGELEYVDFFTMDCMAALLEGYKSFGNGFKYFSQVGKRHEIDDLQKKFEDIVDANPGNVPAVFQELESMAGR